MPTSFDTRRQEGMDPILSAAVAGQQLSLEKQRIAQEAQLAQEQLAGWRQRRELMQRQADTEQQTASGLAQYQQGQMVRDQRTAVAGMPHPQSAVDTARMGAAAGQAVPDEHVEVQRILSETTRTPEAKVAFLNAYRADQHERAVSDSLQSLTGKLQDRLSAINQSPGWAALQDRLQGVAQQLDALQDPNIPVEFRAKMVDAATHELNQLDQVHYEQERRMEDSATVEKGLTEWMGTMPLDDPRRGMAQFLASAVRGNKVNGSNLLPLIPKIMAGGIPYEFMDGEKGFATREEIARDQRMRETQRHNIEGEGLNQQKAAETERRNRANEDLRRADQDLRLKIEGFKGRSGNKPLTKQEIKAGAIQLMDVSQYSDHPLSETEAVQKIVDMEKQIDEIRGREQPAVNGAAPAKQPVKLTPAERAQLKAEGYTDEKLDQLERGG